MAISDNTSRYDLVCFFFVLLYADLSDQVPFRSHRSTDAPNCQTWDTFPKKCGVCSDGYMGDLCELKCRYPNFGKRCQSECFCEEIHCNSTYGCEDGVPSFSSSTMPSTNKTISVLHLTSNKQVPSTAMVNAGSTPKTVCLKGYFGKTCDLPCRYPSFGDHCQSLCHCKVDNCNHIIGCNVSVNVTDCLTIQRYRKDINGMFYSILGLSIWTVIQFCVYLYLSFCYKSYNW
uniref:Multiple epidermal growth factor-like domains protein 11 n=1 Tax=Crassostrea virginica TaxID=6565 RepID=A0A8B8ECY6_CRAVI|nr:multiple epidermal growth factor-like domains protein 11 [Crassostrea virginica]